jgi:alpha-ketoglutaric semialdehyde dehydrogenase
MPMTAISTFRAFDPATGEPLEPEFRDAASGEIDRVVQAAAGAARAVAALPALARAAFLEAVGDEIERAGEELLDRVHRETGLPAARLLSERGRTIGQLRLFAATVREGSWVDARIDRAMPDRQPLPRPDLRRMLVPLGPEAVFGASNFPLAFSVAGGDTASAWAAGCPVIVKAHPAHPGTSELVAKAIRRAIESTGVPAGIFGMVQGAAHEVGLRLVQHPEIRAVGFTGSLRGGRALCDAAAARPAPIPVYAEMGSVNPVFVLPRALATRGEEIARGLAASMNLGAGQFCTSPGLAVIGPSSSPAPADAFLETLRAAVGAAPSAVMVHGGIRNAFETELASVAALPSVELTARAPTRVPEVPESTEARAALLVTTVEAFVSTPRLGEEIYGPATVAMRASSPLELVEAARALRGHLTATVHGTDEDIAEYRDLITLLAERVGRLLFNGFPTGVEVSPAMQHGGPYPASSDARSTSVGTAAMLRFARPVCFQNAPEQALPEELRAGNPRRIWRWVDASWTREAL